MKNYIRPLTKTMIMKLMHCRQIELEGNFCMQNDIKYAVAPLYKRGYIGLKSVAINNKEIMAVFTTPSGINYLAYLAQKEENNLLHYNSKSNIQTLMEQPES